MTRSNTSRFRCPSSVVHGNYFIHSSPYSTSQNSSFSFSSSGVSGMFLPSYFLFNDVTESYCAFCPAGQPPITMWITRRRYSGSGWETSRGSITTWSGGRWTHPSEYQYGNSSSPAPGFPAACASDLEVHADFPCYPFCIWVANSAFSSINKGLFHLFFLLTPGLPAKVFNTLSIMMMGYILNIVLCIAFLVWTVLFLRNHGEILYVFHRFLTL